MEHPLKCPNCSEYRYIEYKGVRFKIMASKVEFEVYIPFFICKECNSREPVFPLDMFVNSNNEILALINEGDSKEIPLHFFFPALDENEKFTQYDHLDFEYDPRDYYIIPGLYREWDLGYLTPVFFDKDLLLYYNNHADFSVRFTSFSSCQIYYKGDAFFTWGFGINRFGNLFKWLGDLAQDFENAKNDPEIKSHLRRFQASNIPSDHDVVSKFYFSQCPNSNEDAFQDSDNELKLFDLQNIFNNQIQAKFEWKFIKIDTEHLFELFQPPIMNEREQIFSSFLKLNIYFIESIDEKSLRNMLKQSGLQEAQLQKDCKKFGSLKLFTLFIEHVLKKNDVKEMIAPLFVLNDLRQLHGHLSNTSFEEKYNSCKERLQLLPSATDLDVFKQLITKLILFYENLIESNNA